MIENQNITGLPVAGFEITLVAQGNLSKVLDVARPALESVIDERMLGEYDYEELERRLFAGEAQLWIVARKPSRIVLWVVTRVLRYPRVKRLSVDLIVGESLAACTVLLDFAANWAAQYGCTEIEAFCRPGIRKILEKHGFLKAYEVIVRPIAQRTN